MKILFVSKTLPHTFQGGIQTHVWKLSEHLLRLGHEVSILTAGSLKMGLRQIEKEGRTLIELPYLPGRLLPLVPTAAEEFSFNIAARRWLLKHQTEFDIIHLQGRSGSLFLENKQEVVTPVVATLHGLIAFEQDKAVGEKMTFGHKIHRRNATKMENLTLQNADALIAVSQEMKSEMAVRMPQFSEKTTQIYNGIDLPKSLPTTAADPNLLLFVGRLTALKGVFPLVEAMKNVRKEIRLVLIGDGDARTDLEKIIQKEGLHDRIQLTGSLDSKGVQGWMECCSALILPSFHETQGIVLMEANALAKPVIGMAVGGIPEVVKHLKNGLLLEDHQPSTIAWGINYLFQYQDFAKQWGQWGRFYMQEKFAWEAIAEQTEKVYLQLLSERANSQRPKANSQRPVATHLQ